MKLNRAGLTLAASVALILAASILAPNALRAGTISTVTFDPAFFNYQPPSGFSAQGGMFELEPIYGSTPVYQSWDVSSSP